MAALGLPISTAGIESSVLLTPVIVASSTTPMTGSLTLFTMKGIASAITRTAEKPGMIPVPAASSTAEITATQ